MQEQTNVQQDLRLWLLGLLPQEQRESVEQRLITDAHSFDEISVVEEELIDDYLADELSGRERDAFESFFMNSLERERQFKVAKALRSYVEREDPYGRRRADPRAEDMPAFVRQSSSFPAWITTYKIPLAAVFSILIIAAVWFAFRSTSTTPGQSLAVFLEPAVQTREGGSLVQVNVARDVQTVELHARLPKSESRSYHAILSDADGNTILETDQPTVAAGSATDVVVVPVSAQRLTRGQYKLQLDIPHPDGRRETAASYRFEVVSQ